MNTNFNLSQKLDAVHNIFRKGVPRLVFQVLEHGEDVDARTYSHAHGVQVYRIKRWNRLPMVLGGLA